jgi:hypothetical protein
LVDENAESNDLLDTNFITHSCTTPVQYISGKNPFDKRHGSFANRQSFRLLLFRADEYKDAKRDRVRTNTIQFCTALKKTSTNPVQTDHLEQLHKMQCSNVLGGAHNIQALGLRGPSNRPDLTLYRRVGPIRWQHVVKAPLLVQATIDLNEPVTKKAQHLDLSVRSTALIGGSPPPLDMFYVSPKVRTTFDRMSLTDEKQQMADDNVEQTGKCMDELMDVLFPKEVHTSAKEVRIEHRRHTTWWTLGSRYIQYILMLN